MEKYKKFIKCAGIRSIKTICQTAVSLIPVRNKHKRSWLGCRGWDVNISRSIKHINKCGDRIARSGGIDYEYNTKSNLNKF